MINETQKALGKYSFVIGTRHGDETVLVDPEDKEKVEGVTRWVLYKDPKGRPLARAGREDGQVLLHRLLFEIPKGARLEWKNGNSLDLRRVNLQLVHKDGTIEQLKPEVQATAIEEGESIRGVYFHKASQRWHAAAYHEKKRVSLGYFRDKDEAVKEMNTFRSEGPNSPNLKRNQRKGK
ncbi:hypothetical protein [Lysinibacillus sp. 54212]|uniref:hypothetical protein n=1 Tax=Lysinibacillus sp. 54212 TaxID=3119829 RepID=UPI002FC7B2F9